MTQDFCVGQSQFSAEISGCFRDFADYKAKSAGLLVYGKDFLTQSAANIYGKTCVKKY